MVRGMMTLESCRSTPKYFHGCIAALMSAFSNSPYFISAVPMTTEGFEEVDRIGFALIYKVEGGSGGLFEVITEDPEFRRAYFGTFVKLFGVSDGNFDFESALDFVETNIITEENEAVRSWKAFNALLTVGYSPHSSMMPTSLEEDPILPLRRSFGLKLKANNFFGIRRMKIEGVEEGSPAEEYGFDRWRTLGTVNGVEVDRSSFAYVLDMIRKSDKETVEFGVKKRRMSDTIEVPKELLADSLPKNTDAEIIGNGDVRVGYFDINNFDFGVCFYLEGMMRVWEKRENLAGYIIDVRTNKGGSIAELNCVADLFLGKGLPTFYSTHPSVAPKGSEDRTSRKALTSKPLVITINEKTASAGEILAGVLQDYGRGVVVGQPSFGKATLMILQLLNDQKVRMTLPYGTAFYPSGNTHNLGGVQPDVESGEPKETVREIDLYWFPELEVQTVRSFKEGQQEQLDRLADSCLEAPFFGQHWGDPHLTKSLQVVWSLNRPEFRQLLTTW